MLLSYFMDVAMDFGCYFHYVSYVLARIFLSIFVFLFNLIPAEKSIKRLGKPIWREMILKTREISSNLGGKMGWKRRERMLALTM